MKSKKKPGLLPISSVLIHAAWCGALAAAAFALPARFTAPARVVFLQAGGPLLQRAFAVFGDAAAGTGTLRDAILGQEAVRVCERSLLLLEIKNMRLEEALRRMEDRAGDASALKMVAPEPFGISAEVVAYDADAAGRGSVAVAAGARHGVAPGQLVVSGGAAVGMIAEAGPYYSRVRLITDPAFRLPVRCGRTRELLILRGGGACKPVLEMADVHLDVREGDVFFSALTLWPDTGGAAVAPGIPAIYVIDIQPDRQRPLFRSVRVRPLVDLHRLEHVTVLAVQAGE